MTRQLIVTGDRLDDSISVVFTTAANGYFCELWGPRDNLLGYAWGSNREDASRFAYEDKARWDRLAAT